MVVKIRELLKFDDAFYIFYTGHWQHFPSPRQELRLVYASKNEGFSDRSLKNTLTPFNAKAMSLFPRRS